jgi:MFS family permease
MAVLLCIAAAVTVGVVAVGEGHRAEQVGFTSAAVLVFGLAATAGVSVLNGSRLGFLGAACVLAALAGSIVTALGVWSTGENESMSDGLAKAIGLLFAAALGLANLVLLLRRPAARRGRVSAAVTSFAVGATVLLTGVIAFGILDSVDDDAYWRWLGAAAAIWILGTALVLLVRRVAPDS